MKKEKCIFCKIMRKEIPAKIEYEDKNIIAFDDIKPDAPVHILIIPKKHISTIDHLMPEDREVVSDLIFAAQKIARDKGIAEKGYRLVFNVKDHGGQIVNHIHLHLLGGKKL
jgi:histidine triad (HIT) family protein